jgi:hypothetical protein
MWDIPSILTALFIFVGNILLVVYYGIEKNREHWDQQAYANLDPDFLMLDWEWRRQNRQLEVAGKMITAVSWVFLTAPVMHLCVVSSLGGDRQPALHVACVCISLGAAIMEITAQLMQLGAFNAADWITVNFSLTNWMGTDSGDSVGWQSLEVSWRNASGLALWIDSIEYLALAFMFLLIFWSINTMGNLPQNIGMAMGGFAFFIGILSVADFVAYVIRFRFWETASMVGRIISVMNRVIFIPLWFLCLACKLPTATRAHEQDEFNKTSGVQVPASGDERHID